MDTVQLSIRDAPYAAALREQLQRSGACEVHCVDVPDAAREGVIVIDSDGLDSLAFPLCRPERVVLITRNDPAHLSRAWNAGIRSVVFCEDPLATAVLAIMAAELRVPKGDPGYATTESGHAGVRPGAASACRPRDRRG